MYLVDDVGSESDPKLKAINDQFRRVFAQYMDRQRSLPEHLTGRALLRMRLERPPCANKTSR